MNMCKEYMDFYNITQEWILFGSHDIISCIRHENFPDFSGIPDCQGCYSLTYMYRSQSQLSVEL